MKLNVTFLNWNNPKKIRHFLVLTAGSSSRGTRCLRWRGGWPSWVSSSSSSSPSWTHSISNSFCHSLQVKISDKTFKKYRKKFLVIYHFCIHVHRVTSLLGPFTGKLDSCLKYCPAKFFQQHFFFWNKNQIQHIFSHANKVKRRNKLSITLGTLCGRDRIKICVTSFSHDPKDLKWSTSRALAQRHPAGIHIALGRRRT